MKCYVRRKGNQNSPLLLPLGIEKRKIVFAFSDVNLQLLVNQVAKLLSHVFIKNLKFEKIYG